MQQGEKEPFSLNGIDKSKLEYIAEEKFKNRIISGICLCLVFDPLFCTSCCKFYCRNAF